MFVMPFVQASRRQAFHPLAALRSAELEAAASLARAIYQPRSADAAEECRSPALDVDETASHYLLSFELPGATKESLRVSVEGRKLRLETIAPPDAEGPQAGGATTGTSETGGAAADAPAATPREAAPRSLYRERHGVRFARTVSLPQEVDSDASQARFENGVLTLSLAKRQNSARNLLIG